MKKAEYLKELEGLTKEGLAERIESLQEEKMKLRFRMSSGQLEQTHRVCEVKTQLAQAKTVYGNKFLVVSETGEIAA